MRSSSSCGATRSVSASLPQGILFDLDDTLIAYDAVADQAWRSVCERCVGDTDAAESLFDAILMRRAWYWSDPDRHRVGRLDLATARREIVDSALATIGRASLELADQIASAYAVERDSRITLLPGAVETLEFFAGQSVPLVLVTNGTRDVQRAKIERFSLERYFKEILVEGEMGFGKPHAAVYQRALAAIGAPAPTVWSVGDNLEWDVYGPQRSGMKGIWHDYGQRGLPLGVAQMPDKIIHSVAELSRRDVTGDE
jgi:putative hydrolase of the HAD superfamily